MVKNVVHFVAVVVVAAWSAFRLSTALARWEQRRHGFDTPRFFPKQSRSPCWIIRSSGSLSWQSKVYWFAILLAVNLQTSFLTPPFGFALFYLKAVAPPEIKIQAIYQGIIPFVMLQLGGLGLVLAFPELALWLPRVLLD